MLIFFVLLPLVLTIGSAPSGLTEQDLKESLFIVHFSTGPAWDPDKAPADQQAFAEHSANLSRLRSDGQILFGGRYEDLGLIILRTTSIDAATELLSSDPGVQAEIFKFTVSPIYVFYEWED